MFISAWPKQCSAILPNEGPPALAMAFFDARTKKRLVAVTHPSNSPSEALSLTSIELGIEKQDQVIAMAVLPTVVASAKGELEFATISLQRQVKIWRYSSTPKCTLELLCSTPEAASFHTLTSHKTELWYSPNGKAIVAVFAPIGNSVASYTKGSNNSENAKPIMLCWKRVIDEGNSTTVQMQKVSSEDSSLPGSTNRSFSMVSAYRLPPSDEDLAAAIVTMPLAGSDMDNNIPVDDVFGVALDGRSGLGLTGEQGQLVKMAKRHSFASFGCMRDGAA